MRPLLVAVALGSAVASRAFAVEFRIDDAWGRDTVQFRTTAPLEDVVGSTNQIKGKVAVDPKDVHAKGTQGRIEIDQRTFKTGLSLRDQHLAKTLKGSGPAHAGRRDGARLAFDPGDRRDGRGAFGVSRGREEVAGERRKNELKGLKSTAAAQGSSRGRRKNAAASD
jgi:hypothetical protein